MPNTEPSKVVHGAVAVIKNTEGEIPAVKVGSGSSCRESGEIRNIELIPITLHKIPLPLRGGRVS